MNIIEQFNNGTVEVNCRTKEESDKFLKILDLHDIKWVAGGEMPSSLQELWIIHEKNTHYACIEGELCYGTCDRSMNCITFEEFMEEYNKMKKFTKDDLKVGMLVEIRSGQRAIVMPTKYGELYFMFRNDSAKLDMFDENLKCVTDLKHLDIVRVYNLPHGKTSYYDLYSSYRDLLWERKEIKEMTIDEISEALGYKVKVVGGDK